MAEQTGDLWWLFRRQTMCARKSQTLRAALRIMVRRGFRHLPVVDNNWRVVGLLSAQDVIAVFARELEREHQTNTRHAAIINALEKTADSAATVDPITTETKVSLIEAIGIMTDKNIACLPVVETDRTLRGIITLRDIVYLMGTSTDRVGFAISGAMTRDPVFVEAEDTICEAIRIMAEKKIRRLPVLSSSSDVADLQGVTTSKDILRFLESCFTYRVTDPDTALDAKVSQIMTRGVMTVEPEDDIRLAAYTMNTMEIGGLVVRRVGGPMIGIVTERDIVHKLYRLRGPDFMAQILTPKEEVMDQPTL